MTRYVTHLTMAAIALTAAGCSFIDDFGRFTVSDAGVDSSADAGDSSSPDSMVTDTGIPDTRPPLPECATAYLEPGVATADDTRVASDEREGSCGGAGSNDITYAFVAPEDDYYRFETNGSSFDTVLYLDDGCPSASGVEIACNDDGTMPPQSEVVHPMVAGELAIVIADGNAGDSGDLIVTASAVACPDTNLTPAILPVETTTVGRPDEHASACGGGGAGDRAFRFTATTDGFHRFRVTSETTGYDPLISVERGPVCGGEVVQCHASEDGVAEITRDLSDGEVLTLRVDGRNSSHEGDYRLSVVELPSSECTTTALGFGAPMPGTLAVDGAHTHSGSCGEAQHVVSRMPPLAYENPDVAFLVEDIPMPPAPPCRTACTVEVSADFPFILSAQETGTCNGNEIGCATSMVDGLGFSGEIELVSLTPAGGTGIVILERLIQDNDVSGIAVPFGDGYQVFYGCIAVC